MTRADGDHDRTVPSFGAQAVYANVYKPRLIGVKFAQKF